MESLQSLMDQPDMRNLLRVLLSSKPEDQKDKAVIVERMKCFAKTAQVSAADTGKIASSCPSLGAVYVSDESGTRVEVSFPPLLSYAVLTVFGVGTLAIGRDMGMKYMNHQGIIAQAKALAET